MSKAEKPITNKEIVAILQNVATAYQINNPNKYKFQIIAYQRAADSISHLGMEIYDFWRKKPLEEVAGIGKSISSYIEELLTTGKSDHFDSILKNIPPAVFDIVPIDTVGPKTAYKLVSKLSITPPNSLGKLLDCAKSGKIRKIEGFGEESEKEIIEAITSYNKREKKLLINYAENIAINIKEWMNGEKHCENVEVLGSLRRRCSTIGDIDIAISTNNKNAVIKRFCSYPGKSRIIQKGMEKASIELPMGVRVDLMTVSPESFGSLIQHFTGSKNHNIALREYANSISLSLSEYGIKNIKTPYSAKATKGKKKLKVNKFKTEEEFYKFIGLKWIPPELREDRGEIEAGINEFNGKEPGLPDLAEIKDIKSDLQIHSDFDVKTSHDLGSSDYIQILDKANKLNYEYIAFTEHNPGSGNSMKQIEDILKRKKEWIDKLNYSLKINKFSNIRVQYVFNSLEIDIKSDGSLPLNDACLETLDFALVSIHSGFKLDSRVNTRRILNALSYPKVKIFAHPTARKINERDGIDVDWEAIFDFCSKNDKWIEINCDPMRLDLPDHLVKDAVKHNIYFTLGTDSHSITQMDNMRYGVDVARRGWVNKSNIINNLNLNEFTSKLTDKI